MWGWLKALVAGIVEPLLASWDARKRGQAENEVRNLHKAAELQQSLDDAHLADAAHIRALDLERLRAALDPTARREAPPDHRPKS